MKKIEKRKKIEKIAFAWLCKSNLFENIFIELVNKY